VKLAHFRLNDRLRLGIVVEGAGLAELPPTLTGPSGPATVDALIQAGPEAWARVAEAADRVGDDGVEVHPFETVDWSAPLLQPSKICCVAFNNSANSGRILRGPDHPALFIKPASALLGHMGAIECRPEYGHIHPEPELAVVIGKTARNVRPEDAYDYVFGYTIHNDITSPTMRDEDTFHYRAIHPKGDGHEEIKHVDSWTSYTGRYKCADTFACLGPWIVTKDEIPDPHVLTVTCSHKGELVTEDNTGNVSYRVPELLAFISHYMTLVPGDVISMGTALKKSAKGGAVQAINLNRHGGPISIAIEGIGVLTNDVVHLKD
jgi:2-keto-4-pentenoate hydratase/2-oxohepta-3-ene-1,7-dioic acid hydratase in catechol pathway